jgi:hypothetical protein
MNARAIAFHLLGSGPHYPQRLADGSYLTRCPLPSHGRGRGDLHPSLHIGDGENGWPLVYCNAGCNTRDVLDELRRRGLLDDQTADAPSEPPPPRDDAAERARKLALATRIWNESIPIIGTAGESYLRQRGIVLDRVPNHGGLRWHTRCPWGGDDYLPCIIARYTDAISAEPRGIRRRPIKNGEKARTLGPMGGCVVRLWPDEEVTQGLCLAEGIETALYAATRIMHRGTLLQPMWAAGSANNLENFPVLSGIERLTVLADHHESGRGQEAARRCAHRWARAGREVILRTPKQLGADFNDLEKHQKVD